MLSYCCSAGFAGAVGAATTPDRIDAAIAATGNTAERAYLTRKRGELV